MTSPQNCTKKQAAIVEAPRQFFDVILETGRICDGLTRLYLAPQLKVGKDPHRCGPRRPISLISTAVRILEAVPYHRMLPAKEKNADGRQYAYRRKRGAETPLTEPMDFIHRSLNRGRYVCTVIFRWS